MSRRFASAKYDVADKFAVDASTMDHCAGRIADRPSLYFRNRNSEWKAIVKSYRCAVARFQVSDNTDDQRARTSLRPSDCCIGCRNNSPSPVAILCEDRGDLLHVA